MLIVLLFPDFSQKTVSTQATRVLTGGSLQQLVETVKSAGGRDAIHVRSGQGRARGCRIGVEVGRQTTLLHPGGVAVGVGDGVLVGATSGTQNKLSTLLRRHAYHEMRQSVLAHEGPCLMASGLVSSFSGGTTTQILDRRHWPFSCSRSASKVPCIPPA